MKRVLLATLFSSFSFPLSEAGRKQTWWMANELKASRSVDVFYPSEISTVEAFDGVRLIAGDIKNIDFSDYDELFVIVSSLEFRVRHFFRANIKKSLYVLDGQPVPTDFKFLLRKILAQICAQRFEDVYVLSEFQRKNLGTSKAKKMDPYLPFVDKRRYNSEKTEFPSVLYMGHLQRFKGVDYLIGCCKKLVKRYPNIQIIFAINGLHSSQATEQALNFVKRQLPHNVVVKGVVDPLEELSCSWVYVYPFRRAHGTMAFALSIYEAVTLGCSVIASDVGANREFFRCIQYLRKPSILQSFKGVRDDLFEEICCAIDHRQLPR